LDYKSSSPQIDHDHETGKVRGILCVNCNLGLGSFKDNPKVLKNAINYLGDDQIFDSGKLYLIVLWDHAKDSEKPVEIQICGWIDHEDDLSISLITWLCPDYPDNNEHYSLIKSTIIRYKKVDLSAK